MNGQVANDKERQTGILRDQIVTIGDLEDFKKTLLQEIKTLLQEYNGQPLKQWLRSSEVRKMLGISSGTLQNFRVNRTLAYTKVGGIGCIWTLRRP